MNSRTSPMPLFGVNWQFLRLSKHPALGVNWQISLLMLVTLGLTLFLSVTLPEQPLFPIKVQPQLAQMSRLEPERPVDVIIQKTAPLADVEGQVARLGGVVTKNLSIINALAATMPAGSVEQLGHNPAVRWVSLDAPTLSQADLTVDMTANARTVGGDGGPGSTTYANYFRSTIKANYVMQNGGGIGIAIIDSSIQPGHVDFGKRVVDSQKYSKADSLNDGFGHGTFVAGIAAGNGRNSAGAYAGVAPGANLINVKVSDDNGMATTSDMIAGLQWILEHKTTDNIRVVNISMNSGTLQSYNVDPLCAASEILWFNGIVVVVSAGNNGTANLYPPANDPFVITVGATDEGGNASVYNDTVASFSAYGNDETGNTKPDIVAPGRNLIAPLASSASTFAQQYPGNVLTRNTNYFVMSGTSAAAPVVAGAVALLLQSDPDLNPDQVKYRLKATALQSTARGPWDRRLKWPGYNATTAGAGMLDVQAAIYQSWITDTANTGLPASQMLWTGSDPVNWSSVNWSSVNWSSVNWSSVNWSSVNWSSVNWSSDYFG